MARWAARVLSLAAALAAPWGPARAGPAPACPIGQDQRDAIRDHNTKAKQEFEENKFLLAAREWLAAQALLPPDAGCDEQRATRVDLAARSLAAYLAGLRYDPADAELLADALRSLDAPVAAAPEGPRKTQLVDLAAALECVRAALPDADAALDCTETGRASRPPPVVAPTPVAEPTPPPAPEPAPRVEPPPPTEDPRLARRRRGLAIGLGVSLGLGAGALATGIATWALARTGGSQHRKIRDAAAASLTDDDPGNDVPPNLPPDQDYCAVARAGGPRNPTIADLCDRHDRTTLAAIAGFAVSGVMAAAALTFAALWARTPRSRRHAARTWHLDLAPARAGATLSGTLRF